MNAIEIKKNAIASLEKVGVCIFDEEREKDLNLSDYILDSLLFVAFLIELESHIGIELPDYYLSIDKFQSIDAFCISVEELLQHNKFEK